MKFLLLLVFVFVSITCVFSFPMSHGRVSYSDHKVFRLYLKTSMDFENYNNLLINESMGVKSWGESNTWYDIMVPPESIDKALKILNNIEYEIIIHNVQYLIDKESDYSFTIAKEWSDLQSVNMTFDQVFSDYQDHETIINFLGNLPNVEKISIGQTYQQNEITAFTFGTGDQNIVFHGGIHAREWIGPAVVTFIAYNLITSTEQNIINLLKKFKFTVIPVLNIDGYNYSRTKDRLWRKNRQPNQGFIHPTCIGIDPNRNFGFHWNEGGASGFSCMENFHGSSAFEAKESIAIANYVKDLKNVISYIDFHSYSQLWMYPWGYKCGLKTDNDEKLHQGALLAVQALGSNFGIKYAYGPVCDTIYQASGSSVDYMYSIGVKFPYTVELRDQGSSGFVLSAAEIIPSGKETLAAVVALWEFVARQ